jgi:hypothetical protein
MEKAKSVPKSAHLTTGLWTQVKACTIRQYALIWNDKGSSRLLRSSAPFDSCGDADFAFTSRYGQARSVSSKARASSNPSSWDRSST